ncbi:MAG TPA: DUF1800 domain-containing protein [Thermomicrobiaceae bacterium]|nr:DUF1800 domain-containing protein [Thermomicrobiaceae bacterium]
MPANEVEAERHTLSRREAVNGLALAGLGALLAACRLERGSGGPLVSGSGSPAAGSGATPVAAVPLSDRTRYSHLLRRAGFGAAPGELDTWLPLSWSAAVNRLVDYETIPNDALESRLAALKLDLTTAAGIRRWWLLRMAYSARPLEEKMTLFWHGLLTSSLISAKPEMMLTQNQFFRAHALDHYGNILKGVTRDPAMMHWLNTAENKKGRANENYSRELMELFTLGPGNYNEQDVRESARAFTGLVTRKSGETVLAPAQHDDGQKTFLGRSGNFGPDDILDIILAQPAAAPFMARKLLGFFMSPNPSQASVDAIARTLTASSFDIREAVRALFNLPEFQDPSSYRALVKSPAELVAGTLRQLAVDADQSPIPSMLPEMGQSLFAPPNVSGWPGGAAWLNSGTWLARLNFANALTTNRTAVKLDPSRWPGAMGGTQQFVDTVAHLLVDGGLEAGQRQVLLEFTLNRKKIGTAWFDRHGRATVYLMLALPEYHLS